MSDLKSALELKEQLRKEALVWAERNHGDCPVDGPCNIREWPGCRYALALRAEHARAEKLEAERETLGNEFSAVCMLKDRVSALEALVSEQREVLHIAAYHGCLTGDCPHESQHQCTNALDEIRDEALKALSLTQSHPRILAIGKVLEAARKFHEEMETKGASMIGGDVEAAIVEYDALKAAT